ncbi:MAG: UDP-N-acetylglucosamine 1-carboxyvinyltransferase, partial [Candidatus Berkelbacteria bacterium]
FEIGSDYVKINDASHLKAIDITTGVFPEFSTDMQAQTGVVLTQAQGTSHINETLFENRLGYLNELENMGAKIKMINAHEANIYGPTKLVGAQIKSLDLRAGATMILAGLIAEGETTIDHIEIIDRGYEKIEERLAQLGANIKRIS